VTARRRRGLLLISLALASGGLAASQVHEREQRASERLGPAVPVLVATRDLRAGERVTGDAVGRRLVPARFLPPDALQAAEAVLGARTSAPVVRGGYLTAAAFAGDAARRGSALRRGERAVTVEVAADAGIAEAVPGARVDVLVSTETGPAGGRTTMALAGAELLRVEQGGRGADPSDGPTALATLRVTLRQAIHLTAADNFAREIRLLPRPAGEL
jgi:pilus assembly protein CpaB